MEPRKIPRIWRQEEEAVEGDGAAGTRGAKGRRARRPVAAARWRRSNPAPRRHMVFSWRGFCFCAAVDSAPEVSCTRRRQVVLCCAWVVRWPELENGRAPAAAWVVASGGLRARRRGGRRLGIPVVQVLRGLGQFVGPPVCWPVGGLFFVSAVWAFEHSSVKLILLLFLFLGTCHYFAGNMSF